MPFTTHSPAETRVDPNRIPGANRTTEMNPVQISNEVPQNLQKAVWMANNVQERAQVRYTSMEKQIPTTSTFSQKPTRNKELSVKLALIAVNAASFAQEEFVRVKKEYLEMGENDAEALLKLGSYFDDLYK
ncbi:hypothetical protein VKT23_000259 [Stygiomarasmius scandens]|uniref:Uncharacterized protein n=1 Tax=Marasmiellus scandens TaxID=2682957 RepID=A0ABR1K4L6_9AGAR